MSGIAEEARRHVYEFRKVKAIRFQRRILCRYKMIYTYAEHVAALVKPRLLYEVEDVTGINYTIRLKCHQLVSR